MKTLAILLTLSLAPLFGGRNAHAVSPMDLVRTSLTGHGRERYLARVALRKQAPGGTKFVRAVLREILAFDGRWARDDRRMDLLGLLMEQNPDPAAWPNFARPNVRDELRLLTNDLLGQVAVHRGMVNWRHIEDTVRFISHFDLWAGAHAPFLAEEFLQRTRRRPLLTDKLIRVFPTADADDRARVRADAGERPPFVIAALLWLHGPELPARTTLGAWSRFELSGRGHELQPVMRDPMRALAERFEADVRARIERGESDLIAELDHLVSAARPEDRVRLSLAAARITSASCRTDF